MKRCYFCKKVVWPWQRQYLGLMLAHAKCDLKAFRDDLEAMEKAHPMAPEWKAEQSINRQRGAYG